MLRRNENVFDSIKEHALEKLDYNPSCCGADLHHYMFNLDYFVIYHSVAKDVADRWDLDAFELIEYNIEQEIDAFGECYWIKESVKLNWEPQINLAAYWLGQELLYEVQEELEPCWDEEMTEEDVKRVKRAIERLEY
jgi:hypothetical protein